MRARILLLIVCVLCLFADRALSKIEVRSSLSYMKELADVSNCVIKNVGFQTEVSLIKKFDYSNRNGEQVVDDLSSMKEVTISTYKTKNPLSKAIAYTYMGNSTIYFNTRRNPRDLESMVNTVIHESTHVVGYNHGTGRTANSPVGKEKSVPYWVGSIAEKYVDTCKGEMK